MWWATNTVFEFDLSYPSITCFCFASFMVYCPLVVVKRWTFSPRVDTLFLRKSTTILSHFSQDFDKRRESAFVITSVLICTNVLSMYAGNLTPQFSQICSLFQIYPSSYCYNIWLFLCPFLLRKRWAPLAIFSPLTVLLAPQSSRWQFGVLCNILSNSVKKSLILFLGHRFISNFSLAL